MEPLIRAILSNLVGDEANDIEIISNSVDVHEDGSWNIKFRHPSRYSVPPYPSRHTRSKCAISVVATGTTSPMRSSRTGTSQTLHYYFSLETEFPVGPCLLLGDTSPRVADL
jgi:hypothetical protein